MHPSMIIKRPIVTEKSTFDMNERNRYTFEVARAATKDQIKHAVESLFKVKVVSVNTRIGKGGSKRTRYGYVDSPPTKSATVRVKEGQTIELF